jgi:hypothetical protein
LVPNGSFEDTIACPNTLNQLWKSNFWINPTLGTPDLLHTCSIFPGITAFGYQQPHSGSAYAGFHPGSPTTSVREYIEPPLTDTLVNGGCYQLSFYVNLGHLKYSTDAIQAFFSDTLIDSIPSMYILNLNPQIRNQSGNFFDTLNWTLVQGEFEALGGEKYLIIGNFDSSAYCNWVIADSNATNNSCYLKIDDISLVPSTCTGIVEIGEVEFEIYPIPTFDFLNIVVDNDMDYQIAIYNEFNKVLLIADFKREVKINLNDFSAGIYFYQLFVKNRIVKSGKLCKLD